jgi:hypothetical protein
MKKIWEPHSENVKPGGEFRPSENDHARLTGFAGLGSSSLNL